MSDVKPTFTTEEANILIASLERSDATNRHNIIAKIQTTIGYMKYTGILSDVKPKGYHLTDIPKGEYGQLSKVIEEALELKDAMEQGQKIMCLVELSDILGAIEGYLEKHYGDTVTVTDLFNMSNATKRAFETGQRK